MLIHHSPSPSLMSVGHPFNGGRPIPLRAVGWGRFGGICFSLFLEKADLINRFNSPIAFKLVVNGFKGVGVDIKFEYSDQRFE